MSDARNADRGAGAIAASSAPGSGQMAQSVENPGQPASNSPAPNADYGDTEHAAPYYPPQAEATEIADFLAAFADRYPLMWPTTRRKILWAAESLRFQIRRGYVGGEP